MRRPIFALLLLCAIFYAALSLSRAEDIPKKSSERTHQAPIIQLVWKQDEKGPQIASLAYVAPVQCARGAPIMRMVASEPGKLPNLNNLVIMAGNSGFTTLDIGKATDVKDAHVQSYFATDSDIVVLLYGTDELKMETVHYHITPAPGSSQAPREFDQTVNRADQHRYILHFDFTGDLKNVHKIDDSFEYRVVAEFASGKLLLGGMQNGGKSQWAIADSDCTIRSIITLPNEEKLREDAATSFKSNRNAALSSTYSMFGMTQIVPYLDQLVMVPPGKAGTLYIITESGDVRTLQLHLPAGLEPNSAIAAETSLYVRANNPKNNKSTLASGPIYSIDTQTGMPLQQYDTGEVKPFDVLCVNGDDFIALDGGLWRGSPK